MRMVENQKAANSKNRRMLSDGMNCFCVYIFIFTVFFKGKRFAICLESLRLVFFFFHKAFHIRNPELTNISCISTSDQESFELNRHKNGISN